jgi:hypothetical protein
MRAEVFLSTWVVTDETAETYGVLVFPDALDENAPYPYLPLQLPICARAAVSDLLRDGSVLRIAAIPYTKFRASQLSAVKPEFESLQSTANFIGYIQF